MPDPRAELFRDQGGGYRHRIRAANGEIVHTSEAYTTATDARRGLADLIRNAITIDTTLDLTKETP